nr:tetratricopeptide repeat protein [Bacteroidota bacterium]
YTRAIEYYTLSLKYNEEIGNKSGIGTSLHNIGHVYEDQSNFKKALEYYQRSLKIREKVDEPARIAESEVNLGSVYLELKEYDRSMRSLQRSLKLFTEMGVRGGEAAALGSMGMVYTEKKEYDKAIDYYSRSMQIQRELGDKIGMAISLVSIGRVYLAQEQYEKAIFFIKQGLAISREVGDASGIKQASESLSTAYKKTGKFREALEMHELYLVMWDSINSEESKKELVHQEFKYEYEKKVTADSVRATEEKKVVAAQFKQEQTQRYALYAGLALMIVFGGFIFNRYKVTQRQKNIIEEQKLIVEVKQKEILDSIHYARRIQRSLLPSESYIDKSIKRLFKKHS